MAPSETGAFDADRSFHIRDARTDDTARLVEFNCALAWETEELELDPSVVERGVARVLADGDKGRYFVAEIDGDVIGMLMITYEWSDWRDGLFFWIQSVYVHASNRRCGVFKTLFRHIEQLSRAQGCCGVRLYAHAHNDRAIETYERLGMRHYGYRVFETVDQLRD